MARSASSIPQSIRDELYRQQAEIAARVVEEPLAREPRTVAAVDVHFAGERAVAAAVLVEYPTLEVRSEAVAVVPRADAGTVVEEPQSLAARIDAWRRDPSAVLFPYIPGLLAFREAPACLAAIRALPVMPDLLLVDGQGRAHPRRAGLACHVGVALDAPTIGVAKSILVGHHAPLGNERGARADLIHAGEVVGVALRTRTGVSPVYVSVGNRITLGEAVNWTLRLATRFRLPEPSRLAHRLAQAHVRRLRSSN